MSLTNVFNSNDDQYPQYTGYRAMARTGTGLQKKSNVSKNKKENKKDG